MDTNPFLSPKHSVAAAIALALCASPAAAQQSSSKRESATGASAPGTVISKPGPNYSEPVVRLQQAAQKLREAILNIAQQPAGPRRNQALEEARAALLETQSAMVAVPLEFRAGATADGNETKAMARLEEAAQRLRDATHAMAELPAGTGRSDAIRTANRALFDVQQAMMQLPPEQRAARK